MSIIGPYHTVVLDWQTVRLFEDDYMIYMESAYSLVLLGLRLGLLLRPWDHTGGVKGVYRCTKDAVRLGRGCMD